MIPGNLTCICLLILFCGLGVWLVQDGWFSCVVHWKRDGQTFWRDQIIRILRSIGGLFLFLGSAFILVWSFF
jgi:hypothetical protein